MIHIWKEDETPKALELKSVIEKGDIELKKLKLKIEIILQTKRAAIEIMQDICKGKESGTVEIF